MAEEEEERRVVEGGVDEMEAEGQEVDEEEVFEESPEEEVQVVEWPAGVPQASAKDLVKLSHVEEVRNSLMFISLFSVFFVSLSFSLSSCVSRSLYRCLSLCLVW
jgi:hypothetical protein